PATRQLSTPSLHDALPILPTVTVAPRAVTSPRVRPVVRPLFLTGMPNSASVTPCTGPTARIDGVMTPGDTGRATAASTRLSSGVDRKSTRLNSSHVKISYA